MYCIIPIAGPDLVMANGQFRPLFLYDNAPMVEKILKNRSWYKSGELPNNKIIFVTRSVPKIEELHVFLSLKFPECKIVTIPAITQGALCTCLAGASQILEMNELICIDLIDIDFNSDLSPTQIFNENKNIEGMLLSFYSDNEKYSYLDTDGEKVKLCVEKKVISTTASAGVYFYKNLAAFLFCATESIKNRETVSYKNLLFICPSFSFLSKAGHLVIHKSVEITKSLSEIFKN